MSTTEARKEYLKKFSKDILVAYVCSLEESFYDISKEALGTSRKIEHIMKMCAFYPSLPDINAQKEHCDDHSSFVGYCGCCRAEEDKRKIK